MRSRTSESRVGRPFGDECPCHPFQPHEAALQALLRPRWIGTHQVSPAEADKAIALLYEQAVTSAIRFCRLLGFRPYADNGVEAVSEWFCQLRPRQAGRYDPSRPLFAYAYGALWFTVVTMARRARRRAMHPLAEDRAAPRQAEYDSNDLLALGEALPALPECLSEALHLRYFLQLSAREAAGRLGISPNAFMIRVHRAVALLRKWLNDGAVMPTPRSR